MLPKVDAFSAQVKAFLPKLSDSESQLYEGEGIQLVEEYIDYHSVIFYRIQVHVQESIQLVVQTNKADYHLLYNLHSPATIILEQASNHSQAELPSGYDSYIYILKGKIQTDLVPGQYLVYGVLVDIGFIRAAIFKENHFLHQFRAAYRFDKKRLYQSAIWPIKERTRYQLSYIEEHLFKYHKTNEAIAIKVVYDLFDIAIYKNFEHYEKIDPDQVLAERAERMIRDQVEETFSSCSIQRIADQLQISISTLDKRYKRFIGESPKQTWNRLLVQKAKELLQQGYSVKEVSVYCGFKQDSSFSDYFLKHVGMRPKKYQEGIDGSSTSF